MACDLAMKPMSDVRCSEEYMSTDQLRTYINTNFSTIVSPPNFWNEACFWPCNETTGSETTMGFTLAQDQPLDTFVEQSPFTEGGRSHISSSPSSDGQSVSTDERRRRRQEQNRVAQRAHRDKKANAMTVLQENVASLQSEVIALRADNIKLRDTLDQANTELKILRAAVTTPTSMTRPLSGLGNYTNLPSCKGCARSFVLKIDVNDYFVDDVPGQSQASISVFRLEQ